MYVCLMNIIRTAGWLFVAYKENWILNLHEIYKNIIGSGLVLGMRNAHGEVGRNVDF